MPKNSLERALQLCVYVFHMYTYVYILYMCTYVNVLYMYTYVNVLYMYTYVYVLHMYTNVYVLYMYTYVYMYIYVYTYAVDSCMLSCRKLHSPHGEQGCSSPQEQGTQSHNKLGHSAWRPTKRLPWHQIEYLRTLRQEDPEEWTHSKLAKQFGISVSAVTRVLKSKYVSSCVAVVV